MPESLVFDCSTGETTLVPLTPEEIAEREAADAQAQADALAHEWDLVRTERDLRLSGSDWIFSPPEDLPQAVHDEITANYQGWVIYREGVRAITDQPDPYTVVWPIPPPAPSLAITAQPEGSARIARLFGGR